MSNQDKDKDKLRVYEYAKSLNMSSKEIITILKRLSVPVNNHMSVMENDSVHKVEQFFRDVKANAAAKRAGNEGGSNSNSGSNVAVDQGAKQAGNGQQRPAQGNAGQQGGQYNRPQGQNTQGQSPVNEGNQAAPTPTSQAPTVSASPSQAQASPNQGQSSEAGGYQGQRREGQGQGGYQGQRREGQGQGGYQGQRREGQGSGYQGSRPQGQGSQGGSGYQGSRPQGQGSQGGSGYQGSRPQGQGGQGGGGYQGSRPQGQGSQGGSGYQGSRPQGQGSQGGSGYQGSRPQGQGSQGGGGYQGSRPQGQGGQGGGGYQGSRPQGQGSQGGGGYQGQRPQGQGAQSRPGGQTGGARGAAPATAQSARGGERTDRTNPRNNSQYQQNRPNAGSGRPTIIPTGNEELDEAGKGLTAKKTKPNTKRFDDNNKTNFKGNGRNQRGRQNAQPVYKEKIDNTPKKIIVRGTMTVGELCKSLHKDASEVIKKLLLMGVMATINQELDLDTIQLIANEFKVEVEVKLPVEEDNFETIEEKDDAVDLIERAPVVTIMGHVDHGKTTLLDAIRHTNVTEGEAGGITQHIGAYQVEVKGKKITFLDTPGHEAFTTMRARGAQVTDITILVVAADDGVMPQTVEAISHAKAANVPIIVAVNKIDKPGADPDKIKQELTKYELVPEEWGGETIFVNLSAKQRIGLEELLETILLVAEVQELKANPDKRARGTVLEAELDKGRGPVARVLIQHGTLKVGDAFVAGVSFGRVRAMVNDKGRRLKEAGPSTPVEITGLTEVPQAGDPFLAYEDERKARAIAERRAVTLRQSEMGTNTRVTLDDLYKHIKDGEVKDLNVIIKGDVQGSVEALKGSLEKIEVEGVRVRILHNGVGAITESDIILASASNAIIIGFNVRPETAALTTAEQEKVDIRLHRVIYSAIEEIEQAMKGMLDPIFKESIIGHAEVRNIFKISKIGTIAGCMIIDGKITRSAELRVIRGGVVVTEGKVDSLKRFKDDVKEVSQGYECGISIIKYNDLKEGDIIEAYVMETVER